MSVWSMARLLLYFIRWHREYQPFTQNKSYNTKRLMSSDHSFHLNFLFNSKMLTLRYVQNITRFSTLRESQRNRTIDRMQPKCLKLLRLHIMCHFSVSNHLYKGDILHKKSKYAV